MTSTAPANTPAKLPPLETYICECSAEARVPRGTGIPDGWQWEGIKGQKLLCRDCLAALPPTTRLVQNPQRAALHCHGSNLPAQTHEPQSAINDSVDNDDQAATPHPVAHRRCLYEVTLIFHSDKGAVDSKVIVAEASPITAINLVTDQVPIFRLPELVSIFATPATLGLQG